MPPPKDDDISFMMIKQKLDHFLLIYSIQHKVLAVWYISTSTLSQRNIKSCCAVLREIIVEDKAGEFIEKVKNSNFDFGIDKGMLWKENLQQF